ncbi:hypothetical protein AB6F55_04025 [Providencia hangzhouensis]
MTKGKIQRDDRHHQIHEKTDAAPLSVKVTGSPSSLDTVDLFSCT